MKYLILLLFSAVTFAQNPYRIQPNTNLDDAHKKYEMQIVIDTTIVKDIKQITVIVNSEKITPEGNIFYLLKNPLANEGGMVIKIGEEARKAISKKEKEMEKKFISTKEFNLRNTNKWYKIHVNKDSIYPGEKYEARIEIDSNVVGNLAHVSVKFNNEVVLKREGNQYILKMLPGPFGLANYSITIENRNTIPVQTATFEHGFFVMRPKKKR